MNWRAPSSRAIPPILAVLFALAAGGSALWRPFWFDELISYRVAQLSSLGEMWDALRATADGQPPLTHICIRLAHTLFGASELGTRIPYIVAFGAGSGALYRFVGDRLGSIPATFSVLLVWSSYAAPYASEARPYALVFCFCAFALLFWRSATAGPKRAPAITGFVICLIGMVSSHYYAGLLLSVFAVGEIVRSIQAKKVDWPICFVICASPMALAPYWPLIEGVRGEYLGFFWRPVKLADFYLFYYDALGPNLVPVVLLTAGFIAAVRSSGNRKSPASGLPLHELCASIALALVPILYVAAALMLTQAFVPRYAIASILGIAIVVAAAVHRLFFSMPLIAKICCVPLFAHFLWESVVVFSGRSADGNLFAEMQSQFAEIERSAGDGSAPIVVEDPLLFLQYSHYAPPTLKQRIVYPFDVDTAREIVAKDSAEVSIERIAPWSDIRAIPYDKFRMGHREFYVVSHVDNKFGWILRELEREGKQPVSNQRENWFQIARFAGP